ncbi:hypothetical protein J5N97_009349 [Dioscorea zingiberensis]|uniref:Protein TIFY n=1 Tax=Dioscorea zingiberensis TaxID=325984 RepID=A0A9D5HLK9_9LILI|nr:hypothetical protein J5N97_009349 [Dioscorea zingiberensis]
MGKQDKSNFSVTCSLLSQYLKQNRSFADLMASRPHESKGSSHRPPTPMNLFPGAAVVSEEETKDTEISEQNGTKSMDLFPQQAGFGPSDSAIQADQSNVENASLTIFYGGKVLVFDNFPAEKARDLMQIATKGLAPTQTKTTPSTLVTAMPTSSTPASNSQANNSSDMPIARRASLHRFLEKRKERINAKAPYQVNGSPAMKLEDNKSWLGLGPHLSEADRSFELRR